MEMGADARWRKEKGMGEVLRSLEKDHEVGEGRKMHDIRKGGEEIRRIRKGRL